jgi:hypothetical protein
VVAFSDVHFNPFDDPTLCTTLESADISAWAGIFQGSQKTPLLPTWHEDTNYPLLMLALANIKGNLGTSPLMIFDGDLLSHGFSNSFYQHCKGLTPQQTPSAQDVADMETFANTTATFVMQQVRSSVGNIPVMFAVGNNDSYTGLGPNSAFLAGTVEPYYTYFVSGSAADYPTFFNSFTAGGYYAYEPIGANLRVISLNTNLLATPYPGIPANDGAAYAELAWLDAELASAQAAGQKVWLLMHVPPGADTCTSAQNLANDGSLTDANVVMMWTQAYQESFLQILAKYPGLIPLSLGGHTHRDEFRLMTSENVLNIPPSISPWMGNDPAFEIYSISSGTYVPTDYRSLNYDLATAPVEFSSYYTFSTAYSMSGALDGALEALYSELKSDSTMQAIYASQYNSGNNTSPWNPISDANLPVFICGIGNMAQADFLACVNSY